MDDAGHPVIEWSVATDRSSSSTTSSTSSRPKGSTCGRSRPPRRRGRARGRRGADARQRRPDRPRGRRPGVLPAVGGARGAAGAEPVPVAGRLHAHGAPRAGACHRAPEPAEPADAGRPRRLRVGGVRQGGAAGGDRRDDDRREARRRPRAAARDGVRGVVGQGARERPTGDSGRRRRCAADLGLADGSRARAGRDRGAAGAGAGEPRRGDGAGTRARGGAGPGRQRRRAGGGGGSPLPGGCAATGCGTQRDRWGSRWRMRGWTRTRARGWPSQ